LSSKIAEITPAPHTHHLPVLCEEGI
jgi:hypothetical protein